MRPQWPRPPRAVTVTGPRRRPGPPPAAPAPERARSPQASAGGGSVGDVALSEHMLSAQADEQLALDRVAPPELVGALLSHVAYADPDRVRQHLLEVGAEGHRAADRDERERRPVVVHAHARPAGAGQRAALQRAGAGVEDDVVALEHEPDRHHVRAAIAARRGQLAGPGADHDELPPLGIRHRAHRGLAIRSDDAGDDAIRAGLPGRSPRYAPDDVAAQG